MVTGASEWSVSGSARLCLIEAFGRTPLLVLASCMVEFAAGLEIAL
jgi:hypothetical protein